ncbi:MAG: hypothetical protein IPK87_10505 [Planctomycetes bacterium]|nr:hypothetical protein [Planctomycetota bacterium]
MTKWITALVAILAAGICGAFLVPQAEAQRALAADNEEPAHLAPGDEFVQMRPGARPEMPPHGMPGTWQIVSVKAYKSDYTLLLNTVTGETFRMESTEDRLHWTPIPRPGMDRPGMDRPDRPDRPGADRPDRPAPRPNAERVEEEIRKLKEKLRDATDEQRKRIEERIKELREQMRRGDDDRPAEPRRPDAPRPPEPPRGDRERERDRPPEGDREDDRRATDKQMAEIEGAIKRLQRELDEIDNAMDEADKEKRAKLRDRAKEVEREIEQLEEKLNKLRKRD